MHQQHSTGTVAYELLNAHIAKMNGN